MSNIVTIEALEKRMAIMQEAIERRNIRIERGETDEDDCFMSIKVEGVTIEECKQKINILKEGGVAWFDWYTDTEGVPCESARWVQTKFGRSLVVDFADGRTIWTTALTEKGLAKKGLVKVEGLFPAWVRVEANGSGMVGAFLAYPRKYRANLNRATGEYHPEPYAIRQKPTA